MGGRGGLVAPPPARGGGSPKEQAMDIVSNILNNLTGGKPHGGQSLVKRPKHQNSGERGGAQGEREVEGEHQEVG